MTLLGCLNVKRASGEVLVRKVTRASRWNKPLGEGKPEQAVDVFHDPCDRPSLWKVGSATELRRVAIALNEGRDSFSERLDLLVIYPEEFAASGASDPIQTPGYTACEVAASLHYEVGLTDESTLVLCRNLMAAGRGLGKCTKAAMKKAATISRKEGCFSIATDSTSCKCGASRQRPS